VLTAHSNRNHVVCATEKSIAYQLRDVVNMVNEDAGVAPKTIRADGGPARDSFLMQFTADLLEIELQVAVVQNCSALGAAIVGMLGTDPVPGWTSWPSCRVKQQRIDRKWTRAPLEAT